MLDHRLMTAIPYLRRGCRVADVGTDHAYLPIELVSAGIAAEAIATDVNRGPILRAQADVSAAGLSDRIGTLLTDGLHGVEAFAPDSILIFGMGGELIARIIDEAPWVKNPAIRLVLQPMSKAAVLRRYLNANGFVIDGETLSSEDKIYQTIACRYEGGKEELSEADFLLGKWTFRKDDPLFPAFLEHEIAVCARALEGKKKGSADTSEDERVLACLQKKREEIAKR